VYLHGEKRLVQKDKKGWCCDKILVRLKKFGPFIGSSKVKSHMMMGWWKHNQLDQKKIDMQLIIWHSNANMK
jgi:hypothetical protein